jgi:large repetitive protein
MRRYRPTPPPLAALLAGAILFAAACAPRFSGDHGHAAARARLAALFPDADTLRIEPLLDGVRHVYAWLPAGPWAVHALEIDERTCRADVVVATPGPPVTARATTSALAADAIAAINADFFELPAGTPIGVHATGGRVLIGPGTRPVYAIDVAGNHWQGLATLRGAAVARGDSVPVSQVNRRADGAGRHHPPIEGLALFDEFHGAATPDSAGATVRLRRLPGGTDRRADAGMSGMAVVVSTAPAGAPVPLDREHIALQAFGSAAEAWLSRRSAGDTVRWHVAVLPADGAGQPAVEVVGGFPLLVADGRGILDRQTGIIPSFGPVRHPRTAVAWNVDSRRVWWVTIDGRQPPYSDGVTLEETEWLMLRLGASHAINLDGGGSTAFVVAGTLRNRTTDREGERAVGNALALRGCR